MAIYMKIDGLKGDATDRSHAQWIQLTHIHFNMQRQIDGSVGDGSQREVSRPYFSEAVISKEACSASGGLFALVVLKTTQTQAPFPQRSWSSTTRKSSVLLPVKTLPTKREHQCEQGIT